MHIFQRVKDKNSKLEERMKFWHEHGFRMEKFNLLAALRKSKSKLSQGELLSLLPMFACRRRKYQFFLFRILKRNNTNERTLKRTQNKVGVMPLELEVVTDDFEKTRNCA